MNMPFINLFAKICSRFLVIYVLHFHFTKPHELMLINGNGGTDGGGSSREGSGWTKGGGGGRRD